MNGIYKKKMLIFSGGVDGLDGRMVGYIFWGELELGYKYNEYLESG